MKFAIRKCERLFAAINQINSSKSLKQIQQEFEIAVKEGKMNNIDSKRLFVMGIQGRDKQMN